MTALKTTVRSLRLLDDWRLWGAAWLTALGVAIAEAGDFWAARYGFGWTVLELTVFWGLWIAVPYALKLLLRGIAHTLNRRFLRALGAFAGVALCAGLAWARFVEPYQLEVHESSVPAGCGVRVALISDIHLGLFYREDQLRSVVERLNQLDVDAVLVAGDWSYQPPRDLARAYAPISALKLKPYAVLGNHDEDAITGEGLTQPLREALAAQGVKLIEGAHVPLGRCELYGIGDYLAGRADRDMHDFRRRPDANAKRGPPRVMLTHEPSTLRLIQPGDFNAVLVGHTHGGQVNLPWITQRLLRHLIPGGYAGGLYSLPKTELFVTTGLGTDHVPLRFRMPPVIDVLTM